MPHDRKDWSRIPSYPKSDSGCGMGGWSSPNEHIRRKRCGRRTRKCKDVPSFGWIKSRTVCRSAELVDQGLDVCLLRTWTRTSFLAFILQLNRSPLFSSSDLASAPRTSSFATHRKAARYPQCLQLTTIQMGVICRMERRHSRTRLLPKSHLEVYGLQPSPSLTQNPTT